MTTKYTKELLEPIVKSSQTWADVAKKLGLKHFTGNQSHLKKRARLFGIDYSHFVNKRNWRKGRVFGDRKPITFYLTKNSNIGSHRLKLKLIAYGLKEAKCEKCHITEWLGKKVPLELDHINSDHFDNRLENLMVLCPNCHASKDPL